jgi:hypothetical protein
LSTARYGRSGWNSRRSATTSTPSSSSGSRARIDRCEVGQAQRAGGGEAHAREAIAVGDRAADHQRQRAGRLGDHGVGLTVRDVDVDLAEAEALGDLLGGGGDRAVLGPQAIAAGHAVRAQIDADVLGEAIAEQRHHLAQAGAEGGGPEQLVGLGAEQAVERQRTRGDRVLGLAADQAREIDRGAMHRALPDHAGVVPRARDPRQHAERAGLEAAGQALAHGRGDHAEVDADRRGVARGLVELDERAQRDIAVGRGVDRELVRALGLAAIGEALGEDAPDAVQVRDLAQRHGLVLDQALAGAERHAPLAGGDAEIGEPLERGLVVGIVGQHALERADGGRRVGQAIGVDHAEAVVDVAQHGGLALEAGPGQERVGGVAPRALLPRDVRQRGDRAQIRRRAIDDRAVVVLGALAILEEVAGQLGDRAVQRDPLGAVGLDGEPLLEQRRQRLVLALLVEEQPQAHEGVEVMRIGGERGAQRVDRALPGERAIHERDAGEVPQPWRARRRRR